MRGALPPASGARWKAAGPKRKNSRNMTLSDQTHQWQEPDARHHLHPFTVHHELADKRARVIRRAEGCYVWDSEGREMFYGMAGRWCTQVAHGRERLARCPARGRRDDLRVGQAGDWWGQQTMGFTPDPVSMAKGLSSGYVAQVDETVANARCSIEGTRAVLGRG